MLYDKVVFLNERTIRRHPWKPRIPKKSGPDLLLQTMVRKRPIMPPTSSPKTMGSFILANNSDVGHRIGDLEVGLDPNSKVGPISYTDVVNIKASLKEMTSVGAGIVQDIKDVANGLLTA